MESYEQNFGHYYQKLVFQENAENDFITCSALRKRMTQMYAAAIKVVSNESTCILLEKSLGEYTAIVDNKHEEAVNNYAKPTKALAAHCKTEADKWKCSLSDASSYVAKYIKPLQCDLVKEEDRNVCSSWDVTEVDIQKLKKAQATKRSFTDQGATPQVYERKPIEIQDKRLTRNENIYPKVFERMPTEIQDKRLARNENISAAEPLEISQQRMNFISNQRAEYTGNSSLFWKKPSESHMPQTQLFAPKVRTRENEPTARVSHLDGNMVQQAGSSRNTHSSPGFFKTARDELGVQNMKKWGNRGGNSGNSSYAGNYGSQKRSLGTRRGVMDKFVPPIKPDMQSDYEENTHYHRGSRNWDQEETEVDERLKNIDPKMIELIKSEIMDVGPMITWDDIAGLEFAKSTIQEVVVWPLLRPDIFTGLRRPPKGILLFGPPGTGKTLIGKCIASQSHSTFFSISASSLTSKWIGDGEKMVRALFAVARCHQPAVVFIDEIDSLLTQRSDTEHESSRRIKTEFLVQLDGAATGEEDRILVIGATNRPQELDEAARRRLVKKLYIPLPETQARQQIVERLMSKEINSLTKRDIEEISELTAGYSGADMKNLCQEASLGPIRSLGFIDIQYIQPDQVRPVSIEDFKLALTRIRASVSPGDLDNYVAWDKQYGSGGIAGYGESHVNGTHQIFEGSTDLLLPSRAASAVHNILISIHL